MRALSDSTTSADTMTLETCGTFCAGHTFFGVEYAREWYAVSRHSKMRETRDES